jgi:hypothetical protein
VARGAIAPVEPLDAEPPGRLLTSGYSQADGGAQQARAAQVPIAGPNTPPVSSSTAKVSV